MKLRTFLLVAVLPFSLVACAGRSLPLDAASQMQNGSATVDGNIIAFAHNPSLRIKVDPAFAYLGRHGIRIGDLAAGERLIFADMRGAKAARLFILQVESFNDDVEETYNYNLSASPEVAGYKWRSNAFAFNVADSVRQNPGAESDATAAFLNGLGVQFAENWMMWRSLTVTSADRRSELILFYAEDLADTGRTLNELYDENDESTKIWRDMMPALERRANDAFSLAVPGESEWRRIPGYFDQDK